MAKRTVILGGNPKVLLGRELKVGDPAPDFELVGPDLSPVKLSSFRGKVVIISAILSLDTSVCTNETHRFEDEAAQIGDDLVVLTVTMDVPYTMRRWVQENAIERVKVGSDHKTAAFGEAYGVLMGAMRMLARAVFVVDRQGVIRFIEVLPEVGKEPEYDRVMEAAKKLL
jgi:thiol peroxidase